VGPLENQGVTVKCDCFCFYDPTLNPTKTAYLWWCSRKFLILKKNCAMLHQLYHDLLRRADLQREVAQAKEQFAFKPFLVEYRPLRKFLSFARWLLACFSIATGFGCLFFLLFPTLPSWLAGLLATAGLLLIEWLKHLLGTVGFRQYYRTTGFPWVGVPALAIVTLSIGLSLQGVQRLHKVADRSEAQLTHSYQQQRDSLQQHYEALIAQQKKALTDFQASVSWRGKINLHNPTTARTIDRMNAELQKVSKHRQQAEVGLETDYQQERQRLQSQHHFDRWAWLLLSALVEAAILACLWFGVYYAYRVQKEATILAKGKTYSITPEALQEFAGLVLQQGAGMTHLLPEVEHQEGIGFKTTPRDTSNAKKPENGGLNPGVKGVQSEKTYLARYAKVVEALEQGASNRQVVERCGVSLSTVHNVKRCMRVVGEKRVQ
jgi:hypothetical protein